MQNSTGISTRELFFKKLRKHFPFFLELHILLRVSQSSHHVLCTLQYSDLY